jgi:hypothetical protein
MDTRNLITNGNNYNVFADQFFERQDSYAVFSTVASAQTVPAGTNQLISYTDAVASATLGITFNANKTVFSLSTKGVYVVQAEISCDLPATAGCQGTIELLVDGISKGYDVAYANSTTALTSIKQTIKSFVIQGSNAPQTISLRAATVVGPVLFRYANLAIFKIGSVQTY